MCALQKQPLEEGYGWQGRRRAARNPSKGIPKGGKQGRIAGLAVLFGELAPLFLLEEAINPAEIEG